MKYLKLRKISIAALCAIGLLGTVGPAWAGPDEGMGGPFARDVFSSEKLASDLQLSETQRAAVERLMDDARKQARPYVRQMLEQHKAMRALIESETMDENAVRAQAAQGANAMTELAVLHARNMHELRKLLTPAQREKMQQMHGRHHRR